MAGSATRRDVARPRQSQRQAAAQAVARCYGESQGGGYSLQDAGSNYWRFRLDPKLERFYTESAYTLIDWQQRLDLKGDLARWLHLWVAKYAQPYAVTVAYLHEKSSSVATLREFRRELREALQALKEAEIIKDYRINPKTDLVHIERGAAISASQARHIVRKKVGIALPKPPSKEEE
jgi:hypothetical protein